MSEGAEAVQLYQKALQVLASDQKRYQDSLNVNQTNLSLKQQASAYASICELYMTPPLCDEADAEATCEQAV